MRVRSALWLGIITILLAACSGKGSIPPLGVPNLSSQTLVDAASQNCTVSYDGFMWYSVPSGSFAPIQQQHSSCTRASLSLRSAPPIPAWAKPSGATQAIFVATSLQENYVPGGMQALENVAAPHHVPLTWLAGSSTYLANASLYNDYHANNGDDVQVEPGFESMAQTSFPWYVGGVSVLAAGRERNIGAALAAGDHAFWGIAWNSHGIDGTADYGAPWGTYCADVNSYKRPAPDGSCTMLAFEWTARDLTRAYLSGHEEYFSTDPDDLLRRGGFSIPAAQTYVSQLADAYAAAGESQPLVMVSQQETAEALNQGDTRILDALYGRAVADGMKIETLSKAANDARAFSNGPRAIAFPFIGGGKNAGAPLLGGVTIYPATIDYHDTMSAMTFLAGETLPRRVFRYADDPTSTYNIPLPVVPDAQLPALTNVAVTGGAMTLHFTAPVALHYGIALWTDPAALGLSGAGVVPAGHAGVVLVFDLQSGPNDVSFSCAHCTGTTFPYAI